MSTRINLLPWREMKRREQDKKLLTLACVAWACMAVIVGAGYLFMNDAISYQKGRNAYMTKEIEKVKKEIEEIEEIRERKADLIARMNIIQQLQLDRTQVVHVFDDLVRKLPKGVYFTQLKKNEKILSIEGFAQTNSRVSELMTNLESSEWFANADLDVINVTDRGESKVSKFNLTVNEAGKKEPPTTATSVRGKKSSKRQRVAKKS